MRVTWVFWVFPAFVLAQDGPKPGWDGFRAVHLPTCSIGMDDKSDEDEDRLVVTLDGKGGLSLDYVPEPLRKATLKRHPKIDLERKAERSLGELAQQVHALADAYDALQRERSRGQLPTRDGWARSGERTVSRLYALLRVDRDADWKHVTRLLGTLDSENLVRTQFATAAKKDEERATTALSRKVTILLHTAGSRPDVKLSCAVTADGYRFGKRETKKDAEFRKWIREAADEQRRAGKSFGVIVEGKPGLKAGRMLRAVGYFGEAEYEWLEFRGIAPPPDSARGKKPLPR